MRQQQSILQWASHILEERVGNLKAIQDVKFAKNLLWKIDDMYFTEWENGSGSQSYAQVLEMMGKYFKDEIGTDISQHIESLNVYRNVFEVWELALGIAIKGNNRSNNINLIFQMDRAMQAQLVKIVTNIIDKFGQAAANLEADQPAVEEGRDNQDRQMVVQLLQENQELRDEIRRIQTEYIKQQQDKLSLSTAKKELEQSLQSMRLQKMAFFQILSNANRSDSKIFEDDDGNPLQVQPNLAQLAQQIVLLLGQQRKKINQQTQKNSELQDEIRQSQDNIRRCIDENEAYMSKLVAMNKFEKEIQNLRNEKNQIFQQNLGLLERIATLEDHIANLNITINRRALQVQEEQVSMEQYAQKYEDQKKKKGKEYKKGEKRQGRGGERQSIDASRVSNEDLSQSQINIPLQKLKSDSGIRRNMQDQLKQPQLRNKMQRQIIYLKTTISGLNRQVQALKKANQALQRSAKEFLDNNQLVVNKWQDDYQVLLTKMGALSKINEQLSSKKSIQQQKLLNDQKGVEKIQDKNEDLNKSSSSSDVQVYQQNKIPPSVILQVPQIKQKRVRQEQTKKSKEEKVALWDEIVSRLRAIVKEGKVKELTYESTIKDLKNQNSKLIQLIRASKQPRQIKQIEPIITQTIRIPNEKASIPSPSKNFFLNMQRTNSQQMVASFVKPPPRLSFIDIQQGEELDEDAIRQAQMKSKFYNVNSQLIHEFDEKASSVGDQSQEHYRQLDRRLSLTIQQGFNGLGGITEDIGGSVELQKQMGEEMLRISKQYQKLNRNYQNVFKKLHIYTESMKEKQALKQGYKQVLDEISKAEKQIQASHHSQILKLRLTNQHLTQRITQVILQKQEIIQTISKLSKNFTNLKEKQQEDKLQIIQQVSKVLTQVQQKYNDSMKNPLSFLDACLQGSKDDGQLQKFYRLYVKQREKAEKLNEELELLSSVLLEYHNMLNY